MPYAIENFVTQAAGGGSPSTWDSANFTAVAGETLIAFLNWKNDVSVTSLTDIVGTNDSWTLVGSGVVNGTADRWRAYYLENVAAGSCTLRVTWSGGVGSPKFNIVAVSGLAASPLDTFAENIQVSPGTGTDAITSGLTPTLAAQPAMLLGGSWNYTALDPPAVGTDFINIGTDTARNRFEHKRLTATDAVAATFTNSPANSHATIAIVFTEDDETAVNKTILMLGVG